MANEIQATGPGTGKTVYALVWQTSTGKVWNGAAFESYTNVDYATYPVALVEQGSSNTYLGNFPAAIPAGVYGLQGRNQLTGSPLQSDPIIGTEDFQWNGSAPAALSDTLTSGGFSLSITSKIPRGTMVQNFPFKLVSSTDHISPLVSGIVSGQIFRDNGSFGGLQSGLSPVGYQEIGNGWYVVKALTSGDLLANTVGMQFLGAGVSGGISDVRDIGLILQRTSGF